MSRGRGRRDNELIGQTVRISQGPYKGKPLSAGRPGLCWRAHLPDCLTPSRLHWCGEGCHGVHSPSGAALNLPDHLCRSPAAHHRVCVGLGKTSVGLMAGPRENQGMLGIPPTLLFCVHSDSQRPGGMTSTYGRTPMYGSQTPMYGSGSRTPMYGSQTPLQDGKIVNNTRDEAEGSADRTE